MIQRRITLAILILTTVALVSWDIYAAVNGVDGDTISQVIFKGAQEHPSMPFSFGVLMGHLFWPQRR